MKTPLVFLYPGQGSQHAGMGADLYQAYPEAGKIFSEADQRLGFPLSKLCFNGPEQELNRDLNAQLAVYTVSCIMTDIFKSQGIVPDAVTGYSAGFYGALYTAGCYDFGQGLDIVRMAGKILLEEGKKIDGAMAVIFGLSADAVRDICLETGDVDIAIYNTPRQIVISGLFSSVKKVMETSLAAGALDAYLLNAATAYHSEFVTGAGSRLLKAISDRELKDPAIPVFSYTTLNEITGAEEVKDVMCMQLNHPVRWVQLIRLFKDSGMRLCVEVGPGAVLARTVRWIDRNVEMMVTDSAERLNNVIPQLSES